MEVLCSSQDDRCIAISVPIQFETPIQTPDELEAAFRALADKADDARREADPDALPRKAEEQCAQLQGLLALLNRDFESHLRYFALVYAKECLREEELERANLVVLTRSLALELLSRDLVTQSRRLSEVSILFSKSCANADEVEGDRRDGAARATGERDELRADGRPRARRRSPLRSVLSVCVLMRSRHIQQFVRETHAREPTHRVTRERPPSLTSRPLLPCTPAGARRLVFVLQRSADALSPLRQHRQALQRQRRRRPAHLQAPHSLGSLAGAADRRLRCQRLGDKAFCSRATTRTKTTARCTRRAPSPRNLAAIAQHGATRRGRRTAFGV